VDVPLDRADGEALFGLLEDPRTAPGFFERVAEDVDWTVMGTHPLAGRYTSKAAFTLATFDRLTPLMREGVRLRLRRLFIDGDTMIAELQARSTTLEGAAFDNHYCWVCRFAGDRIVEVRAYLDSAMVAYTVDRNESR
jgi:ketosteroid isomerase-like protein